MSARWLRIIPVVFVTSYSLAFLDRTNFSFALAGAMGKDLNITSTVSSLLGSLFFLGYFFFQIPGARYAADKSAKKLIFWSLIAWGALAMATGMLNNVSLLMGIRFLLGVVESAVMPALLILLSRWFTRKERSRANTFLILGNPITILWMSVLSGYLIRSVGWRWMFIIEGAPAILWAFIWVRVINDRPEQVEWLSADEKKSLLEKLQDEQLGIQPVKNYWRAFQSRVVILLSLQHFLWSIGVYGFVIWLPSIIKSAPDMDIVTTGWLTAIPYVFAILGMVAVSYYSDRTGLRKKFVWPFLLVAALAFTGVYFAGGSNFGWSLVLLVIAGTSLYIPYGPFFASITELLPANVTAGAIALINSFGALGSFTGAYLVGYLNGTTKGFGTSYILHIWRLRYYLRLYRH